MGLGGALLAVAPAPIERSDIRRERRPAPATTPRSPDFQPAPGRPYRPRRKKAAEKAGLKAAALLVGRWIPQINLLINVATVAQSAADALAEWQLGEMDKVAAALIAPQRIPMRPQKRTVPQKKPEPLRRVTPKPQPQPNPLQNPAPAPVPAAVPAPIPAPVPAPAPLKLPSAPPPAGRPAAPKKQQKPKKSKGLTVFSPEDLLKSLLKASPKRLTGFEPSRLGLSQANPSVSAGEQTSTQQDQCQKGKVPKRKKGECRQGYFSEKPDGTTVYKTWSTRKCGAKLKRVK